MRLPKSQWAEKEGRVTELSFKLTGWKATVAVIGIFVTLALAIVGLVSLAIG